MPGTLEFKYINLGEVKLESCCKVMAIGGAFDYEELYGANDTPTNTLNSIHKGIKNKIGEILKTNQGPIIVALPELYGSQELDEFIKKRLQSYKGKAVIIAGSYYVKESDRESNRATIHVKIGNKYDQGTQYKRLYSPEEKRRFHVEDDAGKPQIIFENTGFGDFSVIICSDLDSRQSPNFDTILDSFTNKIDMAFVIAFNKGVNPHRRACKKVSDIYNYLVYVNGQKHRFSKNKKGQLLNHLYMYYPFAEKEYEEKKEMKQFGNGLYCGEIEFDVRYLEFAKLKIMPLLKDMEKKGIISKPWKTPVTGINPRHFSLALSLKDNRSFELVSNGKILAIGSHWDDILLGCLGTLLKLKLSFSYEVTLVTLCDSYNDRYYGVEQQNLNKKIEKVYGKFRAIPYGFNVIHTKTQDGIVDRKFRESKILRDTIQGYSSTYSDYNLIFCPPVDDDDEDHAVTGRLVRSSFRNPSQTVLEYEIKKYTEGLFVPNVFIGFDEQGANEKVNLLSEIPKSIDGAERLFSKDSVRARLIVNANNYNKDRACKYGEIFRGRIQP